MQQSAKPQGLRRPFALLTLAAMLLTGGARAALIDPDTPAADKPAVRIVATAVDGGKYVEVGLNIDSADGVFQSAGAVLRYDPAKLQPVAWTGNAPSVPKVEAKDAASAWSQAKPLPTKTGDGFAEKYALAFELKTETPGLNGYLYLSAAAAETDTLQQAVPETGETDAKAASGLPLKTADKATAATAQATVVRFQVQDKGEKSGQYTADELLNAIDLVRSDSPDSNEGKILAASPLTFEKRGADVLDGLSYIADNTTPSAAGFDSAANAALVWIKDGVSVATGGGGSSFDGKYAITFFDWDGRVIDAIPAEGDATQTVADFEALDSVSAVLAGKAGYAFDRWLSVDQGLQTLNGTYPSNNEALTGTSGDYADFSNVQRSMLVQAAYKATDALKQVGQEGADYYIDLSRVQYNRYGPADESNGQYSMVYTVERKNKSGAPVERIRDAGAVVRMTPKNGQDIISLVQFTSADTMTFEIVPTKTIKSVQVYLIDLTTANSWPSAGSRSGSESDTKVEQSTFVSEGTLRYIYTQAVAQTEWNFVDANAFQDACGKTPSNLEQTKKNVLDWVKANAESDWNKSVLAGLVV